MLLFEVKNTDSCRLTILLYLSEALALLFTYRHLDIIHDCYILKEIFLDYKDMNDSRFFFDKCKDYSKTFCLET